MGEHAIHALDGISLDIDRGDFMTIVGASGSGKSTLMHILGCLDLASEGTYIVDGQRVADAEDPLLSSVRNEKIGFVFQQFNLLSSLTVLENIALPLAYAGLDRETRQSLAKKSAERVGLGDRLHHTPLELSGGQAQRVAIARALVNNPAILLADEPTGALDSKTGNEIMDLLKRLHDEGTTVIIVTHDPRIAEMGSRSIELSDGKIINDVRRSPPPEPVALRESAKRLRIGLSIKDILHIGLKEGLLAHKLRTGLTMLGVIIGVASVITMSSISQGSKKKQANQIRELGANLIRVVDEKLENQDLLEARTTGSVGLSSEDARAMLEQIPTIQHMACVRQLHCQYGQRVLNGRLLGVDADYPKVNNLSLDAGRHLAAGDLLNLSRNAVIGKKIARQMKVANPIGEVINLGGQPYTVVGVLRGTFVDTKDLEASGANDANYDILIPLDTALNRTTHLPLRSELDEIQIQLDNEDSLSSAGTAIRRVLQARHRGQEDFQLVIPLDLLKTKQQSERLLDLLSLFISAISLVVGGIGIMNIMLASVTERMKEIGIRRAIGATQQDIQRQFLTEAVCIAAAGGLLGVVLAIVGIILCSLPFGFPIVFQIPTIIVSVAAAFATGLGFGYYPASKAASQNLVEILQHD
jgi:macrolide transport system ATP-binding/permease protein